MTAARGAGCSGLTKAISKWRHPRQHLSAREPSGAPWGVAVLEVLVALRYVYYTYYDLTKGRLCGNTSAAMQMEKRTGGGQPWMDF